MHYSIYTASQSHPPPTHLGTNEDLKMKQGSLSFMSPLYYFIH